MHFSWAQDELKFKWQLHCSNSKSAYTWSVFKNTFVTRIIAHLPIFPASAPAAVYNTTLTVTCTHRRRLHRARGHVPPLLKMAGHGRAPWVEEQQTCNWPSRKRSPKRLIVFVEPKKVEGHDQKCVYPSPTFKFIPAPLLVRGRWDGATGRGRRRTDRRCADICCSTCRADVDVAWLRPSKFAWQQPGRCDRSPEE